MKVFSLIVLALFFLPLTANGGPGRDLSINISSGQVVLKPGTLCLDVEVADELLGFEEPLGLEEALGLEEVSNSLEQGATLVTLILPEPLDIDADTIDNCLETTEGMLACIVGPVPKGGSASFNIEPEFPPIPPNACFSIQVDAIITAGAEPDPNPSNDMDCVTVSACAGLIFADGFECGHLLDWTSVTP